MKEYGGVSPWIFLYTVISGTYERICIVGLDFPQHIFRGTYERILRGLSLDFPVHCKQWNSWKEYGGVCPWIFLYTVLSGTHQRICMVGLDFPLHICRGNYERIWRGYCDKTLHHTTFMSLNVTSLNDKTSKTLEFQNVNVKKHKYVTVVIVIWWLRFVTLTFCDCYAVCSSV